MKKLLGVALGMAVGSLCVAGDVRFGDSLETVISVLGQPDGCIQTAHRSVVFYERGSVEMEDGRVVSSKLISPKAAEARRLERLRQEQLARQAQAKRAAEGRVLRDSKLADPSFLALPAVSRAAYWESFMRNYPGVDVGMDYDVARRELQAEAAARALEAERMRQYAELQERAAAAEQRAADAEARARASHLSFARCSYPVFLRPSHSGHLRKNASCPSRPPRPGVNLKQGRGLVPTYARVRTTPRPLDGWPNSRWSISLSPPASARAFRR